MRGKAANVKKNLPGALRTIVQDHFKKKEESLSPWKHSIKKKGVTQEFCTVLL